MGKVFSSLSFGGGGHKDGGFAKVPQKELVRGRWCPEEEAGFVSTLLFSWVTGLLKLGNKKTLEAEDLWDVHTQDRANTVAAILERNWADQLEKKRPSLLRALLRSFGFRFRLAGLLKLVHDLLQFMSPILIRELIQYLKHPDQPLRNGVALAALLLLSNILQSLCIQTYFQLVMRSGLHIRTSLIALLYNKALRMSTAAKQDTSVGEIVNLQSNDAQKLSDSCTYLHIIWSGPLQIFGALGLLFAVLGVFPALAGLCVMLLLLPFNLVMVRYLTLIRKRLIAWTDQRVQLVSEVIHGIKAIKLYAWEAPFLERIKALRAKEVQEVRTSVYFGVWSRNVFSLAPTLVAVVSFSALTLWGIPLEPTVAFPALALFNILRFPLTMFPRQINQFIQAGVAIGRVQNFLLVSETTPVPTSSDAPPGSISLRDASFCWAPVGGEDAPTLADITLTVAPGSLVIVVGEVGSGKSSLLAAVLGEIRRTAGDVAVNGSIAYTAQDPWIQNATVQDNIIVSSAFEKTRYERTLAACALAADLRTLPGGDQAEIGEKGINLSGGQKHRVALARAVYTDAEIYLLDDPLSAVDTHVGRHLFDACICGHLGKKTRVLVTHQLQFVPAADAIVVLKGGRIAEYGTYEELRAKGVDFAQFEDQHEEKDGGAASSPANGVHDEQPSSWGEEGGSLLMEASNPSEEGSHTASVVDTRGEGDVVLDLERDLGQSSRLVDWTTEGVETIQGHDGTGPLVAGKALGGHAGFSGGGVDVDGVATLKEDGESHRQQAQELELMKFGPGHTDVSTTTAEEEEGDQEGKPLLSQDKSDQSTDGGKADARGVGGESALVPEEARAVGRVQRGVYLQYIAAWGPGFWVPALVLTAYTVSQSSKLLTNAWLAVWTEGIRKGSGSSNFYLSVYAGASLLTSALVWLRGLALAVGCVTAARTLQTRLLDRVLRLPMAFFDSTPTGRLINRFTRDTEQVDLQLPDTFSSYLTCVFQVCFELLIILYVTPLFIGPLVPLVFVYWRIQDFYIASSRELKRLDSVARSPIFAHFGESIQGLSTLRAFRLQRAFVAENEARVDASTAAYYATLVTNRWLGLRLEMLGSLTVFATALFAVWAHHPDAGFAGLALTSALSITGYMNWMVRMQATIETDMNSVERVLEYTQLSPEAPAILPNNRPPTSWPSHGAIQAERLVVRYRADLDPVLKGLSFSIRGGEKVGVCGRTGCGKTTLMMALYRIMELASGRLLIDGLDVATIGLRDLRSRLALVPQDPVVFSGSIRSNLDPFGECKSDRDLWDALRQAGMASTVGALPGQLEADVAEGGANLSVGQRQLLCMARALLRKARILVLDEATSNVDSSTDSVIQDTIRSAFQSCTVLTIAHRLHTIIDSDRVMLLDNGTVAEFDSPSVLLANDSSLFTGFVNQTLPKQAAALRRAASSRSLLAAAKKDKKVGNSSS